MTVDRCHSSVAELRQATAQGRVTVSQICDEYRTRIKRHDADIHALIYVGDGATAQMSRRAGSVAGASGTRLLGSVIVVKDNYNTTDMPTTGGCTALRGFVPRSEGAVIQRLRHAGATVLGKANLHELALGGTTISSIGGQTRNPYDLTRTPGGSSGGSAAAVAMGFCTAAMGTDTVNSIRSPASACNVVGLRPTRGLVSRAGIIPVSTTQDAAGPLARTVADAAEILDVIAGYDPEDPITAASVGMVPDSYTQYLLPGRLRRARLGLLAGLLQADASGAEVTACVSAAVDAMRDAGADITEFDEPDVDGDRLVQRYDVQHWEFRHAFEDYLRRYSTTIHSLIRFMELNQPGLPAVQAFLAEANRVEVAEESQEYLRRIVSAREFKLRLVNLMAKYKLDAFIYPLQSILPARIKGEGQLFRNGIIASVTGLPALTVPIGFSTPDETAPVGVPIGLDILGRSFSEGVLLALGADIERLLRIDRRPPETG
ncbi:MAG TPA: amidase [Nevskiaceae bacterium]